jgi:siroheme synthase
METEDPDLIDQWTARWSDLAEFEVVPVITSAVAAARVLGTPTDTGD